MLTSYKIVAIKFDLGRARLECPCVVFYLLELFSVEDAH